MLELIRSNRLEALLEALGERLQAEPLADPMQAESIVVPSRGMERWLSQRLSQRLGHQGGTRPRGGICAHVEFPFPGKIAHRALEAVGAFEELDPEAGDPWRREQLVWHVLAALAEGLESGEADFEPLRNYLGSGEGPAFADGVDRRAFGLAHRVASVFDRYAQHRHDIVEELLLGKSEDSSVRWQSALWRAVAERVGVDPFCIAQRKAQAAWRASKERLEALPPRLSLFGFASMSPALLATFDALSQRVPCHLYVLAPSAVYWADTRTRKQLLRESTPLDQEALSLAEGHPLLASSGRVAREFQGLVEDRLHYEDGPECFVDPCEGEPSTSALTVLQSDLLWLRNRELDRDDAPRIELEAHDDSIRVHACHGKARQVEVLREAIIRALDEDPTLSCRDILVMSPDIEAYAPLIESVFARGEFAAGKPGEWTGSSGTPRLRINIADRIRHSRDPLVRAVVDILGLVRARRSLSEILDLLGHEPVRARFGIDAEELEGLLEWSHAAGARWGSDAAHRRSFDQPGLEAHTWRAALDRMAVGVTMSRDAGTWSGVAPFDAIEGQAIDLFSRFNGFCETLFAALARLEAPRSLRDWSTELTRLAQEMLDSERAEQWRSARLSEAIAELATLGDLAGADALTSEEDALEVTLDVVTRLIVERVDGGGLAIGQQGAITFCAMAPMRSIPHRVVALLGMDHGAFPRAGTRDGFDLMARRPQPGDPLPREAERFLFIEALLAARDRLIVTYSGCDPSRGEVLPPANVIRELLEHLGSAFCLPEVLDPEAVRAHFCAHERLHAHHPSYFAAPPASFDRRHARAAVNLVRAESETTPDAPTAPEALVAPSAEESIDLEQLVRTLTHPARAHAQDRLGVFLPSETEELPEREALELDGLERWRLDQQLLKLDPALEGERFASDALELHDEHETLASEAVLPPGTPGAYAFAEGLHTREQLQALREGFTPEQLREQHRELRVELDDAVVHGRLRINGGGTRLILSRKGTVSPRDTLRHWVEHLAWQSATDTPVRSVWLRAGTAKPKELPSLSRADARDALAKLVDLYRRNHSEPLAFFPGASQSFAKGEREGKLEPEALLEKVRKAYDQAEQFKQPAGEGHDPYNQLVWGEHHPVTGGESFKQLARDIWGPMLEREASKSKPKSKSKSKSKSKGSRT